MKRSVGGETATAEDHVEVTTDDGSDDQEAAKRREREWLAPKTGRRTTRVGESFQCVIPALGSEQDSLDNSGGGGGGSESSSHADVSSSASSSSSSSASATSSPEDAARGTGAAAAADVSP